MSARQSFNDRLEQFFKSRPGRWIAAIELEAIAGRQAWRTRVSDVRRLRGLNIRNRTRKVRKPNGEVIVLSEYQYIAPQGQMELL